MSTMSFFAGHPQALAIHRVIEAAVADIGPAEVRVSKSQVGFYRARAFATTWMPEQVLRRPGPPLVLTLFLRRRDRSIRWKEVVEPAPGRFTHHVELTAPDEVDDFVRSKLTEAWAEAG